MIFLGIDPGQKGGLGKILSPWGNDHRSIADAIRMPDISELDQRLRNYTKENECYCVLEKAQAMKGQGVSSMFNYGVHFGEIRGLLLAHKVPYTLVTPQAWMKVMHQGTKAGDTKQRSVEACQRLFPGVSLIPAGCKVVQDGMAEALLMAEYGRRLHSGKL